MPAEVSANVWVEGDRARLEVQASEEPNLAAGIALLTSDRGEHLVVLDSAKQEFFSLPRSVIAGFKQQQAERSHLTCDPILSEKLAEDSGPELAGYPTRHLRFRLRLAAHQLSASGELTTQIEVFEHFWLAAEISQHNTDLAMLSDSYNVGIPPLDEFLHSQILELPGFILKSSVVVTLDDSLHNHGVRRTAYEVTELAVAESPATLFEVPDGFHLRVPRQAQPAPPAASPSRP
jgi:hypothetical protein